MKSFIFRYMKDHQIEVDIKRLLTSKSPMFEAYKKLSIHFDDRESKDQDMKLFMKLKNIIIKTGFILDD